MFIDYDVHGYALSCEMTHASAHARNHDNATSVLLLDHVLGDLPSAEVRSMYVDIVEELHSVRGVSVWYRWIR